MSTFLNTVAGTTYEDFIRPSLKTKPSEARASQIIKLIVVIFGTICAAMVLIVEKLGALIEMTNSFGGLTSGTILGLFILGLFFPSANTQGAMWGSIASLTTVFWLLVGNRVNTAQGLINHPVLPLSVEGCDAQLISSFIQIESVENSGHVFFLYKISIFYYGLIGCSIVVIVGLIVSQFTGPNQIEDIHPDLLSPLIHRFIHDDQAKAKYSSPLKETTNDSK